jgi:hypothetical protein
MPDLSDLPYSVICNLELDVDVIGVYPIDERFRVIFVGDTSQGDRAESSMIFSRDALRALKTALARFVL